MIYRDVSIKDAERLMKLRSLPDVAQASNEPPPADDQAHMHWMRYKLQGMCSGEVYWKVLLDDERAFMGVVRLDRGLVNRLGNPSTKNGVSEAWELNVAVFPRFRRSYTGLSLVLMAVEWNFGEGPHLPIIARVKYNNQSSLGLFQKAGFGTYDFKLIPKSEQKGVLKTLIRRN